MGCNGKPFQLFTRSLLEGGGVSVADAVARHQERCATNDIAVCCCLQRSKHVIRHPLYTKHESAITVSGHWRVRLEGAKRQANKKSANNDVF